MLLFSIHYYDIFTMSNPQETKETSHVGFHKLQVVGELMPYESNLSGSRVIATIHCPGFSRDEVGAALGSRGGARVNAHITDVDFQFNLSTRASRFSKQGITDLLSYLDMKLEQPERTANRRARSTQQERRRGNIPVSRRGN